MTSHASQLWVQLPDGKVKGPFEARKVFKTMRAGRVPAGSHVSEAVDGPWMSLGRYFGADERVVVPSSAVPEAPSLPLRGEQQAALASAPLRPELSAPLGQGSQQPSNLVGQVQSVPHSSSTAMPAADAGEPLATGSVLSSSMKALFGNYWSVVTRSIVSLLVAGALLALPLVLWIVSVLASYFIDVSAHPWLASIQDSTLVMQLVLPCLLVPFGFMFLVSGTLMVLGACEGSELRRWSTLFEWRKRFVVMYALGYVATGAELAAVFMSATLFGGNGKSESVVEQVLSATLDACPIVFLTFSGMMVLTSPGTKGVWGTIVDSLRWGYHGIKANMFAGFRTAGAAILIAAISLSLVLPFPLFGFPLLMVVIGVLFRRMQRVAVEA